MGSRYMIVDGQGDVEDMACVYSLNGVAAFLWQKAAEGEFTVDRLADMLCLEYEVERETAVEDVCALLAQWRELQSHRAWAFRSRASYRSTVRHYTTSTAMVCWRMAAFCW